MEGIKSYGDLVAEINRLNGFYKSNLISYNYYLDIYNLGIPLEMAEQRMDGMPRGSSNAMTLDTIVDRLILFQNIAKLQSDTIEQLRAIKKTYEDFIAKQGALKYLVIQMYYIDKKTLGEIASDLNYSYSTIKRAVRSIKNTTLDPF